MPSDPTIREEELKNSVAADVFGDFDCLVFTLFHGQNRISCGDFSAAKNAENAKNLCAPLRSLRQENANHWIPFTEEEVGARDCMKSHFMADFLSGRGRPARDGIILSAGEPPAPRQGLLFTDEEPELFAASPSCTDAGGPAWSGAGNGGASPPGEPQRLGGDASPHPLSPAAAVVLNAGRALWRHYHAQPDALPDASFYDIRARFQGFKPNGHTNPDSPDAGYTRLLGDLRSAMKTLAARIAPKVREHGFLR